MSNAVDKLELQITEARRSISADGYSMSVGELVNLYRENELILRPEFQRYYRWTTSQKSRLIESILLGIPLPSIFVAQVEGGKWELVDGLQRISTLLELQGELLDDSKHPAPLLILQGTKFLPALEGRTWQSADASKSLSEAQRLDIKRAKLDIKIVKRESSPEARLDLFQRLNSYGTSLTSQELRSALLFAVSPSFLKWLEELVKFPAFIESIALSDRLLEERYDLELLIRFLVLHNWPEDQISLVSLRDFPEVLDNAAVAFARKHPNGTKTFERVFKSTFEYIATNGGEDVFRKWEPNRSEFRGSFLNTAFEVFALGVGFHEARATKYKTNLIAVVKEFWAVPRMKGGFATGMSTEKRLVEFLPLGRTLLKK